MARQESKNRYLKNARMSEMEFATLLRAILRGIKAADTAHILDRTEPAIRELYKRVRSRLFTSSYYLLKIINRLAIDDQDAFIILLKKLSNATNEQIIGCVFYCSSETPPGHIRRFHTGKTKQKNPYDLRRKCRQCPLNLMDYSPSAPPQKGTPTLRKRLEEIGRPDLQPVLGLDGKLTFVKRNGECPVDIYRRLFKDWFIQKQQTDVADMWVSVVNYLADYRRLNSDTIFEFCVAGALQTAILSRDLPAPPGWTAGMRVPEALSGPKEYQPGWTCQNDLEGPILYAALDVIEEFPI